MYHPQPLKKLDEQFEQLLDEALVDARSTELTPELRRERRRRADNDALAFAKTYFPGIFDAPWSELHRHIAGLDEGKHSISGFRKSGKSAMTYIAHAVRRIALGMPGMIGVVLRTQDKAEARVSSLARIILRNRKLVYDYDIKAEQTKAGYCIINGVHLVAGSVNTGLRAYVDDDFNRFAVLIGDDLYDKETVRSELDNQRVYEFITDEMWGQLEDDGLCIVPGNKINADCPICKLEANYQDGHFSFPIVDEEGNPNWPAVYDKETIGEMEQQIPADTWHGQYLDDPLELGEVFDPEWLRTINANTVQIVASITAVDPARGESPHACRKAAISLGATSSREAIVHDVYVRQEPYGALFNYLHRLIPQLPAFKVVQFENDFEQWEFARPYYTQWMKETGAVLPIRLHRASELVTQHRAADKVSRILNLVHPHQTGAFWYAERVTGTTDYERYKKELLAFNATQNKKKVDGPDAASTAYILIWQYVGSDGGSFQSLQDRQWARPHWDGSFR